MPFGAAQRRFVDECTSFELAYCIANLFNNKAAISSAKAALPSPNQQHSELQILVVDLILRKKFLTILRSFAPLSADEIAAELERILQQEGSAVSGNAAMFGAEQIYFCAAVFADTPRLVLFSNSHNPAYPKFIYIDCEESRFLGFDDVQILPEILTSIREIAVLYSPTTFDPVPFNLDQLNHILDNPDAPRAASD